MIAELAARPRRRRRRIDPRATAAAEFATARRFEDIAAADLAPLQIASLARNAELVFGAVVIGLQLRVAQRPVDKRGIRGNSRCAVALDRLRAGAKIVLVQAPRHRAVMDGAAAGLVAVALGRDRGRAHIGIPPPGDGLALRVRAQILPLEVAQFIVRVEVLGGETRAALEPDDFHARFAELGREDSAGRAHAHDDDVGFFRCHGFRSPIGTWAACASRTAGLALSQMPELGKSPSSDGCRRTTTAAPGSSCSDWRSRRRS